MGTGISLSSCHSSFPPEMGQSLNPGITKSRQQAGSVCSVPAARRKRTRGGSLLLGVSPRPPPLPPFPELFPCRGRSRGCSCAGPVPVRGRSRGYSRAGPVPGLFGAAPGAIPVRGLSRGCSGPFPGLFGAGAGPGAAAPISPGARCPLSRSWSATWWERAGSTGSGRR